MILNTIEWIYNLKLKNMKMTIYSFIKNCEKTFLWIMSTLLENDNNIILWEIELWVLYLKVTIILFYEKVWNDFYYEYFTLWLKSTCTTTLVNYGFSSTIGNVTNKHS